jgi:type I restriction enzyme S subunit
MEVKPGYKQTEVGVIPEDWSVQALGDLGQVLIGLTYKPEQVAGHGTLVLRSSNIHNNALTLCDNVYVVADVPEEIMTRPGDILICVRNGSRELIGKTALLDERCIGMTFGAFMAVFRSPIGSLVNYCFQSSVLKLQIAAHLGATINQITNKSLRSFKIAIPSSREESERIVVALQEVDSLIEATNSMIAKKKKIKQAAMQELLTGKRRLPGFEGEWEVKKLGEICEIAMGRTPSRLDERMWGSGHPWLSIGDLKGKVVSESKEQITESAAALMTIVRKGTLLMSFKLSIGRLCFAGCDLFTNEAICSFNRMAANAEYLYYALSRTDFSLYGKQAVKGYTLNKESLRLIEIKLPCIDEQVAIAAILSDMDAELAALEARRDKTRALKQAMMQELLTGRIRLR